MFLHVKNKMLFESLLEFILFSVKIWRVGFFMESWPFWFVFVSRQKWTVEIKKRNV